MGGGASNSGSEMHLFPIYYIQNAVVTEEDNANANACWDLIENDKAPGFSKIREADDKKTAIVYFYERFYESLFMAHPSSEPLFKNSMAVQGRALVHMIKAALSLLKQLDKLVPVINNS